LWSSPILDFQEIAKQFLITYKKNLLLIDAETEPYEKLIELSAFEGGEDLSELVSLAFNMVSQKVLPPVWRIPMKYSGMLDVSFINENCCLIINRGTSTKLTQMFSVKLQSEDWCMLRVIHDGQVLEGIDAPPEKLKYSSSILTLNNGFDWHFTLSPQPFSSVIICFNLNWLLSQTNGPPFDSTDFLDGSGLASKLAPQLISNTISGKTIGLVNDIQNSDPQSPLYSLEVAGLVHQLLACTFQHLVLDQKSDASFNLKEPDIALIGKVKSHLETNFIHHETLEELSRMFGLNRRKLTEGFKVIYGMTLYEFRLMRRMTTAKELLLQGNSATYAALQVGYSEQSSFSRAFKRYFNYLPSEI